jgi:hypothetical protein
VHSAKGRAMGDDDDTSAASASKLTPEQERRLREEMARARALMEAAERTGVHIDALRGAVKRRALKARKGNDGRWQVQLPPGSLKTPQERPETAELERLRGEVEELRERCERLQGEMLAAKIEAARAVSQVEAKDVLTHELRELLTQVRSDLREAQRPWWRRWFDQR